MKWIYRTEHCTFRSQILRFCNIYGTIGTGDMMQTVDFFSLYTLNYNLDCVFAMRQNWKQKGFYNKNHPRSTGCLLYFVGCAGEYRENRRSFTVPKGSVVYIPEGSVYKTRFFDFDGGEVDTILIEFSLLRPDNERFNVADKITVVKKGRDALLHQLFVQAADEQSAAMVSTASMKAVIYQILNHLSRAQRQKKLRSKRFYPIAEGITYLETDPGQEKSIQEIAKMCFVSPATFRRLFKEYAGVSPVEYRIAARIEYAKNLLRLGTMTTTEVAREVGFEDPAYFCRIFKKRCGVSPGQYLK